MRIAQVSPLFESVPPASHDGTEQVVSHLTEELVRQGHEVTLFASGDSRTAAELVAPCDRALRADPDVRDPDAAHAHLLDLVVWGARRFDLIHFHLDSLHLPLVRWLPAPHVTTLHGRLDRLETVSLWNRFRDVPVVAVSAEQREALPALCWQGTVPEDRAGERSPAARLARDYLAIYRRLATPEAPYALGPVDVALPPLGGAIRAGGMLVNLDSPLPGPPRSRGEP